MSMCPGCSYQHVCANKSAKQTNCIYQRKFEALPNTVNCKRCDGEGYGANGFRCAGCRGSGLVLPVGQEYL